MNRDDITTFLELAKAESFTAAARRLRVPKQMVSRRIRAMERALGYDLFHRTTRSVRMTENGEAFRSLAEEADLVFERMHHLEDQAGGRPQGVLRIACDPLFGERFLSEVLWRFSKGHPGIELETFLSTRRVDLIPEGFDLAIRIGPLQDSTDRVRSLGPARVRYCASPRYLDLRGRPARPVDLRAHECLAPHYEGGGAQQWLFRKGSRDTWLSVGSRFRSNSFRVLYEAALAGFGIVASPAFYCRADLQRRRLESVLDSWLPDFGNINLVYPAQRVPTSKVRAFVDFASAWFAKHPIP